MSDHVRVLIVGAGRAGLVHGRNFASGVPGAVLQGVADPSQEALAAARAELDCGWTDPDPLDAVTRDDVDAVVIATPTFSHAELAVTALEAGKHVLLEKPLASTMEEAHRISAAAERADGILMMAFMRRFDPGFARVAERIAAGDIGQPLLVRSTGRGPGLPPEWAWDTGRSGGLVAEVNSHDIDTIRWLSGQEPTRVFAVGRAGKRPDIAERHPGFVDVLSAILELSDGGIGQLDGACPADYGYDARVEVYGAEGTLFVGGPTKRTAVLVRADGAVTDPVSSWRELFADGYRAEARHLVDVVRGEAEPRTSVRDGSAALATVVAANRSMATGEPVDIEQESPA
jgi:predicted dehydrogenase